MLIAIDGTAPVIGGGMTYLRELVPELCASSSADDEFRLFLRSDMTDALDLPRSCTRTLISFPRKRRAVWRFAWQQLIFPFVLKRVKADVLLCPYGIAPLMAPCRVVLGIQNASPYYGPLAANWLPRIRNRLLVWLTWLSSRKAKVVFFASEWSRQLIGRSLGVPIEKSCVIYHGVSNRFRPTGYSHVGEDSATRRHVLIVGSIASYKDYVTLFQAWGLVRTRWHDRFDLLIAGPILEPGYFQRLKLVLARLELHEDVSFLPQIPYAEVPDLYRKAAVLIMPSYVETFGLPMLEAMSCGIPVIASDIPVAREVCGDAAYYYELGDPASLGKSILSVLNDTRTRDELVRMGRERASGFTWRKTAERTLRVLGANVR